MARRRRCGTRRTAAWNASCSPLCMKGSRKWSVKSRPAMRGLRRNKSGDSGHVSEIGRMSTPGAMIATEMTIRAATTTATGPILEDTMTAIGRTSEDLMTATGLVLTRTTTAIGPARAATTAMTETIGTRTTTSVTGQARVSTTAVNLTMTALGSHLLHRLRLLRPLLSPLQFPAIPRLLQAHQCPVHFFARTEECVSGGARGVLQG